MRIARRSILDGEEYVMDIPITEAQLADWLAGTPIQEAAPDIAPDLREFLISGITPDVWKKTFG